MRLNLVCASALPALALLPGAAWAADVEAKSRIDAVTVYPDAANVTRVGEVDLPAGSSTLIFRGLPLGIDPNSVRFEADGDLQVSIGSVDLRPSPTTSRNESTVEAKLRALRTDREAWQTTLDALEAKKAMILRFSQSGPEKLSAESKPLEISQWQLAWDTVGQALAKIGDELRAARGKAREIDEDIQALERLRQQPVVAPTRDVLVRLDAPAPAKLGARLTYRIAAAGWQPVYDARLDTRNGTGTPTLELVRRAAITQRTGEDWTGVSMSVSTVRSRRGTSAPELQTQRLAFWEPPRPLPMEAPAPPAQGAARERQAAAGLRKAETPVARELDAQVEAGAFQATFEIPGRVDLPGDGSMKTLRINTAEFAPDLVIKTTPVIDETAYLQVKLTNKQDTPILPGAINLMRDGAYIGSGRIRLIAPGDSADLGFGADDSVKVTRVPVRRKENEPTWYGQTKSEQREYRTTVTNGHKFKVTISVTDQVPISENSAITVEQLPPPATTAPTEKTVNDKRGVLGWTFDLGPGERKEIRLGYRMKWPADRDIVWQTVPSTGPR